MGHYKANLRDIEFNLFEALELGPILDSGSVGELDSATSREILAEVARFGHRAAPVVGIPTTAA